MESKEQNELTNWLSNKNYDFYVTTTFTNRLSDETINRKMECFSNHYLIEELFWVREYTSDGKPHIHMVIKTNKILKSYNKLPKLLKGWGNTEFRLFEKSKSTRCISYLNKEYHNQNSLWGIK
jgi:hypothetical protein